MTTKFGNLKPSPLTVGTNEAPTQTAESFFMSENISGAYNRAIILNAPPKAGKDHIAAVARGSNLFQNVVTIAFKEKLLGIAANLLGMPLQTMMSDYDRLKQEEVIPGYNLRQLLIMISEEWVKPTLGEDFFGKAAAEKIKTYVNNSTSAFFAENHIRLEGNTFLFTDSGFPAEVRRVAEEVSPEYTYIVRVYREGHTFEKENDSRAYLYPEQLPEIPEENFLELENPGGEREYASNFFETFLAIRKLELRRTSNSD